MALAIIRRTVSPIPIGQTPGHLSSAINLQARRGPVAVGSKRVVQRRFATFARDWQREEEADLKAVHNLRQA